MTSPEEEVVSLRAEVLRLEQEVMTLRAALTDTSEELERSQDQALALVQQNNDLIMEARSG